MELQSVSHTMHVLTMKKSFLISDHLGTLGRPHFKLLSTKLQDYSISCFTSNSGVKQDVSLEQNLMKRCSHCRSKQQLAGLLTHFIYFCTVVIG